MAPKIHVREISRRVESLRQYKESLYCALDGYFEKSNMKRPKLAALPVESCAEIIKAGNEWVQSQKSPRQTFQEICSVFDHAVCYVGEKLDELSKIKDETSVLESASPLTEAPHSSATTSTLPSSPPLKRPRLDTSEDSLLRVENERQKDMNDIDDVKEHLKTLSTQIQAVERKQREQHQPVAFTAYTHGRLSTTHGAVIKGFDEILSNNGGHYDATTGMFTAPIKGTYLAAFCHRQWDAGLRLVRFCHERVSTGQGCLEIDGTSTCSNYASSSNVIVLDMLEGNKLYPKSYGNGDIVCPCAFSCALLG